MFNQVQTIAVLRAASTLLTSREVLDRLRASVGLSPHGGTPHCDVRVALDRLAERGAVLKIKWEGWEVYTGQREPRDRYAVLVTPGDQRAACWAVPELAERLLDEAAASRQLLARTQQVAAALRQRLDLSAEVVRDPRSGRVSLTLLADTVDEDLLAALDTLSRGYESGRTTRKLNKIN